MEDHEALETGAVVRKLTDAVQNAVDDLLADRVVTAGVVVRRVFLRNVEWKRTIILNYLAGDELLRVEELLVRPSSNLPDNGRLEIHEDRTRDVLASSSLGKERREVLVVHSLWNRSVRVDAVL